jgi:hypothetical protein
VALEKFPSPSSPSSSAPPSKHYARIPIPIPQCCPPLILSTCSPSPSTPLHPTPHLQPSHNPPTTHPPPHRHRLLPQNQLLRPLHHHHPRHRLRNHQHPSLAPITKHHHHPHPALAPPAPSQRPPNPKVCKAARPSCREIQRPMSRPRQFAQVPLNDFVSSMCARLRALRMRSWGRGCWWESRVLAWIAQGVIWRE